MASFDEVLSSILQTGRARALGRRQRRHAQYLSVGCDRRRATTVAGIYGMNFNNMPEQRWRYGYVIMIALYFGFKRNR